MKRYNFIFLFLLFSFIACKDKDKTSTPRSENSIDAARNFIRAALDGKFDRARGYMLNDSDNVKWMNAVERSYQKEDQSIKDGYRAASINIVRMIPLIKDSMAVLIYSNSFFRDNHDTLKIVKVDGQWLVDLKYLYQHSIDSLYLKDIINNKIK